jgi:hypothetical protein
MKCINRSIIATGIVVLAGLFSQATAQLPSSQPPSAFVARYKQPLHSSQAAPENLPSAQPISAKAIEARIKKTLPVAAKPAGPAAATKLPSYAPPPDINTINAKKIKARKPPPLPGN